MRDLYIVMFKSIISSCYVPVMVFNTGDAAKKYIDNMSSKCEGSYYTDLIMYCEE